MSLEIVGFVTLPVRAYNASQPFGDYVSAPVHLLKYPVKVFILNLVKVAKSANYTPSSAGLPITTGETLRYPPYS